MSKTRDELYSYLKERMAMVAPNLTVLVGELVGARLIAHSGMMHSSIIKLLVLNCVCERLVM